MKVETRIRGTKPLAHIPAIPAAVATRPTEKEAIACAVRGALATLAEHIGYATITVHASGGVEIDWPAIEGVTERPIRAFLLAEP